MLQEGYKDSLKIQFSVIGRQTPGSRLSQRGDEIGPRKSVAELLSAWRGGARSRPRSASKDAEASRARLQFFFAVALPPFADAPFRHRNPGPRSPGEVRD